MPFNFLHRPSRKRKRNPWYENALLLAIAGSIIAVTGQLAGTVIPIMYGPQDVSDFSINIDPISYTIPSNENAEFSTKIAIEDLHSILRHYRFKIILNILNIPDNMAIVLNQYGPLEFSAGDTTEIIFRTSPQNFSFTCPIIIQGIGGDGKIRNATLYLNVINPNRRSNETMPNVWDLKPNQLKQIQKTG
jgi:hypothetical protein